MCSISYTYLVGLGVAACCILGAIRHYHHTPGRGFGLRMGKGTVCRGNLEPSVVDHLRRLSRQELVPFLRKLLTHATQKLPRRGEGKPREKRRQDAAH